MQCNILATWNGTPVMEGKCSKVMAVQFAEYMIKGDFILNERQSNDVTAMCQAAFQRLLQGQSALVHYDDETGIAEIIITIANANLIDKCKAGE